ERSRIERRDALRMVQDLRFRQLRFVEIADLGDGGLLRVGQRCVLDARGLVLLPQPLHRQLVGSFRGRHYSFFPLPNTSTIVAVTVPGFLTVCSPPPLSGTPWPCVTSIGGSPSTVNVSWPVPSVTTCHVASSCECSRRTAPGSA